MVEEKREREQRGGREGIEKGWEREDEGEGRERWGEERGEGLLILTTALLV